MKKELLVFTILGLVSLTADVAYEGARSISGPLLESLKAVPAAAAVVGSGEFVNYVARFFGGYACAVFKSSAVLWATVVLGYLVNLVVVPLLAFTGRWDVAVALYIVERVGKGLRAPSRDTVLAEITSSMGRGKGFGIHEVMDQVGAFVGPLSVSLAVSTGGYRLAFLSLAIPAALSVALVVSAALLYPRVESVDYGSAETPGFRGLPRQFWIYTVSASTLLAGYVHWAIASMYMASERRIPASEVALAYSVAMAVDALTALPAGIAYDRYGLKSLAIAPPAAALALAVLVLSEGPLAPYAVGALWGVVMGLYETNMRAAVADLVEPGKRSLAYGTFGLLTGLSWSLGGFAISSIAGNKLLLLSYVVTVEFVSLAALRRLLKVRS
ncbi:MAG: MFS transporter [Sulfolobales archaeon]|nr:MFS transporter [Sulfolobales archaeon]MCX8208513.1 MFS transporter [Sulfolobales archaeon]MDW8010577.1 MFS transporter [Sulfolobales archaeon]